MSEENWIGEMNVELTDLTNHEAGGLCAYALSRCGPEALSFKTSKEAFEKIGKTFHIKPNTIKNFRDAFDPYTDSTRKGWWKREKINPSYLEPIIEAWENWPDADLINAAKTLEAWSWLPDLGAIWKVCDADLKKEKDVAELEIPHDVAERIAKFLSEKRGYTIDSIAKTAMHITSKTNKQKSIISFAVLSKLKCALPFLEAVSEYKANADKVLDKLLPLLPEHIPAVQQQVYDHIRDSKFDAETLIDKLVEEFGNRHTSELLIKAIQDENWSGLSKSIFRSKKDVLNSVCQNRLSFENVKTGYLENLIEYYIETGDVLKEVTQTGGIGERPPETIMPDLDRNVIFFGAPGTGKSYFAKSYAGADHTERVVFFADYQNSDLVGYLQPQPDEIHGATYKFEKGPLIKALNAAFSRPDRPVVLLIEEINRGNAPAIFGELFQLLDRNNSGESQYRVGASSSVLKELEHIQEITETRQIWLPNNLFVVGTMNSSDQGVFPLDTAFKRRFSFKYLPIDYSAHSKNPDFLDPKIHFNSSNYSWSAFAQSINEALLDNKISEDKLLGPYFLSPSELSKSDLTSLIIEKVCFYLWEDVLRHEDKNIIFNEDLRAFSDLNRQFESGASVFSESVLDHLDEFSSGLSEENILDERQLEEENTED